MAWIRVKDDSLKKALTSVDIAFKKANKAIKEAKDDATAISKAKHTLASELQAAGAMLNEEKQKVTETQQAA